LHYLSMNKNLSPDIIYYYGADDKEWGWRQISESINLSQLHFT
jgi:hypothetical protein